MRFNDNSELAYFCLGLPVGALCDVLAVIRVCLLSHQTFVWDDFIATV